MPFAFTGQWSRLSAIAAPAEEKVDNQLHDAPVQEAHGFKLERHQFIKEYDSMVALYRHQKSGEPSSPWLGSKQWSHA